MKRPVRVLKPLFYSSRALLLGLIVILCCEHRPVSASCGSYLLDLNPIMSGHAAAYGFALPDPNESQQAPECHEPTCRRHHSIPAAPAKISSFTNHLDGLLVAILRITRCLTKTYSETPIATCHGGLKSRVFRPPRNHSFLLISHLFLFQLPHPCVVSMCASTIRFCHSILSPARQRVWPGSPGDPRPWPDSSPPML